MMTSSIQNISKHSSKMSEEGNKRWLVRLERIIETNSDNHAISNEQLAEKLDLSERHLIRKMNELTGLSPQKYLRIFRLKKAMNYIRSGKYKTVKETAHAVGYTNVSYFIIQFEKKYGKRPLEILRQYGWR